MPKEIKAALGILIFSLWGPYLLYIWILPSEVPEWAMTRATRKALFLSREFEPSVFTLFFALTFTTIALVGFYKLATDQLPD
jgi:hypothetical protein